MFYTYDFQGDVEQRFNYYQQLITSFAYEAWGNYQSSGNYPADPFTFGGQWGYYTDLDTSLVLCSHRYYDPSVGKWLTRDPIGYGGGVNLYGYVGNDPVNEIDPSGLDDCFCGDSGGGIVIPPHFPAPPFHFPGFGPGPVEPPTDPVITTGPGPEVTFTYCMTKTSKKSGKEKANNAPSWAMGQRPNPGEGCQEFAERLLNEKYGVGNWGKDPGSEFNKIVKWCERSLR